MITGRINQVIDCGHGVIRPDAVATGGGHLQAPQPVKQRMQQSELRDQRATAKRSPEGHFAGAARKTRSSFFAFGAVSANGGQSEALGDRPFA